MVAPMMFQSMITPKSLYPSIDQQFQAPNQEDNDTINPFGLKSHITSDGNYCWYTKDNEIFFYELNTGKRITTWCFVKESKELYVSAVGELFIEDSMFLVATIKYDNNKTFLKVLDIQSGDVIRTIDIGSSNVNFIKQIHRESLYPDAPRDSMRNFKSPLALGFQNSCQIIILDLYFNPKDKSIESSSKIQQLILQDISNYDCIQFFKSSSINNLNKLIPYFVLGCDQFEPNVNFEYPVSKNGDSQGILIGTTGSTQQTLKNNNDQPHQPQQNCQISSIFYIESIHAIAVGYSIGTFQLFSSINFKLFYCSPLRESSFAPHRQSPVTHILYQELDEGEESPIGNLWIGRGSMNQYSTTHPISIILYKLIFDQMAPDPSKSLSTLISLEQNIESPLDLAHANNDNPYPGEILSLSYLYQNKDIDVDTGKFPKSKSIITYQYINNDGLPKIDMKLFDLALFDRYGFSQTNKQVWLHNIELIKSDLNTSFHSFWLDQDSVSYNTLYQDENNTNKLIPEQQRERRLDASLSIHHPNFKAKLLTFNSVDLIDYLNPQERLVKELSDKGAIIFEHPQATYQRFIDTQIFTQTNVAVTDKQKQKNDLMIFSLNNNLLSIITDYILNYRSSNAKLILDLFWSHFERIQSGFNLNELFSKTISSNTQKQFETIYVKVVDIVRIFRTLIDRYIIEQNSNNNSLTNNHNEDSMVIANSTSANIPENLKNKLDQAINMALFIEVLKWSMNFGFFSSQNLTNMEKVRLITAQKRKDVREKLSTELSATTTNDKLLIDLFYETINMDHSVNVYPPHSTTTLKNFIEIFSNANQFKKKIALFFYLLIDLEIVSSEVKNIHSSETLKSFLGSFKITNKYYSFIMGIWKLDNYLLEQSKNNNNNRELIEEINSAFTLLNSSSITKKFLYPILSRFYSFGFMNYAQLLMKGWGFEPKNFDEASLYIKILLANHAILEAILFQRSFRARFSDLPLKSVESLLFSIFNLSLDLKKLDLIIDMPLDETEEQVFIQYLFINQASSLISMFYLKRGRIPEACKINRYQSSTARNNSFFDGYDTINHLILNYEQSLPSIQKPSNFYNNQQQSNNNSDDIPLLPRSATISKQSITINKSALAPPQSFIQKPIISNLPTPKLYNESVYFSSNLSTAPVSNLEALTKKSEDDKKEKMEIQQKLFEMEEQKKREEIQKEKEKEDLRKQKEAEEIRMLQELEDRKRALIQKQLELQKEQLDQQKKQQQQQQSPLSYTSSPFSSPSGLKSALKSISSSGGSSSSKKNHVRFKESLNQEYPIPSLDDLEYYGDNSDEDYEDDEDEDYDEEDEDEEEEEEEEQQQQQQNRRFMNDEDDEDEEYNDDDDMIIHDDDADDQPDQNKQYSQFLQQKQQQQEEDQEEGQELSNEEIDEEIVEYDEEYDENSDDPFKDIKRPEHGGKEPPKFAQFSMLSKPKSQYKQDEEDDEEGEGEGEREEEEDDEGLEYDDDEGYEENKTFAPDFSDGYGTEDKPMEILSSDDEEPSPPSKNKKVVAHRPPEIDQEGDDDNEYDNDDYDQSDDSDQQIQQPQQIDENESDDENFSDESGGDSTPTKPSNKNKSLESSIEFDQDEDYN
ncbi:hypothetical protein DICPUDRAFT_99925 [Dictyostelium purpureum]|uniref:ELYS-like domain-containing protein n=1 Tax=Dictyostelium purpureum TaxID=5786 RepID=F1A3T8_DICPU|nr:uncharacterized protein DICPUDRAFT_99925 [Dictyostelium purpureum]EGC29140.1 hypothetical protein DICPUDRAFT_99925 [Dictyostelium purpureum]|eukprot:XP_003294332.1 hypothetical protein DICPUDRAFT_99925 [Dictyostelium purpureum]